MREPLDLDAIEQRAQAAPAGIWVWDCGVSLRTAWGLVAYQPDGHRQDVLRFPGPNNIEICPEPEPAMEFIAEARADVLHLLALARAQAAEIARLRKVRSAAEYLLEHTHVDEMGYTHVTGGACDVLATALPDPPE